MNRILVVNVNWIGDVLFSTPVFKALKKRYPQSFIACIIPARCRDILEGNPYIDEIIIFDERVSHRGLIARLRFVCALCKKHFDTVFLLHRSMTRALLVYLAGIPERIGYATRKNRFLLTKKIIAPIESMHRLEYYTHLFEASGIEVADKTYEIFLSSSDEAYAGRLLDEHKFLPTDFIVVINPGGNWDLKRWPPEHFAQLADRLVEQRKAKIIISGSQKDCFLADRIARLMKTKPVVFCGLTTLKQAAALFKRASVVISADSGPMHIATAVGAKVIALFGPTDPAITGPYKRDNVYIVAAQGDCDIPCYKTQCPDNLCMKSITPDMVFAAVQKFV